MNVTVDIFTIILASIPLGLAGFTAAWTLLRVMVLRPLKDIQKELSIFHALFATHEQRIILIEYRLDNTQAKEP